MYNENVEVLDIGGYWFGVGLIVVIGVQMAIITSRKIKYDRLMTKYKKALKRIKRLEGVRTVKDDKTRQQLQQLGLTGKQIEQALSSGFVSLDSGKLNKPQNKTIQ